MSLKERLNTACAGVAVAALAASTHAAADQPETQAQAGAKTQAAAQSATGKPTTDAPPRTQAQGTAWAVKQGAKPGTAVAPATPGVVDRALTPEAGPAEAPSAATTPSATQDAKRPPASSGATPKR